MFNLDERIGQWRSELSTMHSIQVDAIDELEDHLRQELTNLLGLNLPDDERFTLAAYRIGQPSMLGKEFEKLHGHKRWLRQFSLLIAGYLFFETFFQTTSVLAQTTSGLSVYMGGSTTFAFAVYSVTSFILFIALFVWLWKLSQAQSFIYETSIAKQLLQFGEQRPKLTIAISITGFLLLIFTTKIVGSIVRTQLLYKHLYSSAELGKFMLRTDIYDIGSSLLIPMLLFGFVLRLILLNHSSSHIVRG